MPSSLQVLGRSVKRLQQRHHRLLDEGLSALGTTLAQWDALRAVSLNPDASSHALAEFTFQTDQSFGSLATRLLAKGLISRAPGRGRSIIYALTQDGEKVLNEGYLIADKVLERSFIALDQDSRDLLLKLLNRALGED